MFCYDTYSNQKSGQTGTLFVTNYKVSFVTLKFDISSKYVVSSIALQLVSSNVILLSIDVCSASIIRLHRNHNLSDKQVVQLLKLWQFYRVTQKSENIQRFVDSTLYIA